MRFFKALFLATLLSLPLFAHEIDWRIDRFNKTGKTTTVDDKYLIKKLDVEAGTLHIDYSDKALVINTRLKKTISEMDKTTKENYIKTIPDGGYITLFIPRPELSSSETRWFIYKIYDQNDELVNQNRSSAVLTVEDGYEAGKSEQIAVQTIALQSVVSDLITIEITGESCGETQYFEITPKK